MRGRLLAAAVLVLALAVAVAAPALAATPRTSLADLEDEVMCTTCNVPLNIADSPKADQERAEIRDLIARGLTKQQVKAELERRYGPQVLALPPDKGFSLTAYVVPVLLVAAVLVLAALTLPRWRRRAPAAAGVPAPDLSPADAARLDEDLARWDRR